MVDRILQQNSNQDKVNIQHDVDLHHLKIILNKIYPNYIKPKRVLDFSLNNIHLLQTDFIIKHFIFEKNFDKETEGL